MQNITDQLKNIFGARLKEGEPLAKHLNFRIGGPAKWFAEVKSVEELEKAIEICKNNHINYFVLGGGSNTLAADAGFDGLILKMAMREFIIEGNVMTADAGVISASLARASANAGLAGFTWAISLPGTIGGAVRGNAGCFGGETKDYLTRIEVLRDGEVVDVVRDDLHMGYRESILKESNDVVLRVYFELPSGDVETLKAELDQNLAKRKSSQPLHKGSAGCVFKNYEIESDEKLDQLRDLDVIPDAMLDARRISAGWVVDRLGLKGTQIGDAMISEEHGNFIINLGAATADQVTQLISLVKTRARNEFGIQLHEEVKYLGFE